MVRNMKYLVVIRIEEDEGMEAMIQGLLADALKHAGYRYKSEVVRVGSEEELKGLRL